MWHSSYLGLFDFYLELKFYESELHTCQCVYIRKCIANNHLSYLINTGRP